MSKSTRRTFYYQTPIALFILGEKIRREKHFSHQFSRSDFTLGKEKTLRIETNHAVLLKFIIRSKRWGKVKLRRENNVLFKDGSVLGWDV